VLFPSGVVIAERTLYLPSVGAAILAGWLVQWALARRPVAALALAGVMVVGFAARTWTRTPIWHDNKAMILAILSEQPESYRAHATAAAIFNLAKQWPASKREAERSRALYHRDPVPYLAGVEAELALKMPHDSVLALVDSAIAIDTTMFAPWMRLAEVRYDWGDYREAIAAGWTAYHLSPDSARVIRYVTLSAQKLHDYPLADSAFRRAIADNPKVQYLRLGYAAMRRSMNDTTATVR
jgi:tetratricopeptide (TPR) repeat protein